MRITRLKLQNFRCFEEVDFKPTSGINLICGDNASGKTTLLEAMHMLGRGRSFRNSGAREMRRQGSDGALAVSASLLDDRDLAHRVGCSSNRNSLQFKINGRTNITRFELVTALPLQLIDPNLHKLFEQGPKFRRHFLDWGVFHVEQNFFPAWRQYRRALKQRNRALKLNQPKAIATAWDTELVRAAEIIDGCRRRYVNNLVDALPENVARIVNSTPPEVTYHPGWNDDQPLNEALHNSFERDRKSGFTQQGPHRADLKIEVAGVKARAHVSRGQQKLLVAALLLTQARLLKESAQITPILLIDDPAAELGTDYLSMLFNEIEQLDCQCFGTFLDPLGARKSVPNGTLFHVEQFASA